MLNKFCLFLSVSLAILLPSLCLSFSYCITSCKLSCFIFIFLSFPQFLSFILGYLLIILNQHFLLRMLFSSAFKLIRNDNLALVECLLMIHLMSTNLHFFFQSPKNNATKTVFSRPVSTFIFSLPRPHSLTHCSLTLSSLKFQHFKNRHCYTV